MPDVLQNALDNTAPASAPAPTAPAPVNTSAAPDNQGSSDPNTQINDFIEVDGRRPAPQPAPAKPAEAPGKYQDLSAANKGYDELYKLYTQGAARTANTVEKLEKVLSDLPNQLAQLITQPKAQASAPPASTPAPPTQPASRFKFTIDELADPDALARSLDQQINSILPQQQAVDPNKLVEGLAPKIGEIIQQQLAAREEAALRSRAEADIKQLVDSGADAGLVQAAVVYGIQNGKNSVLDSWRLFQNKYPLLFAEQKAENVMGELAGQRQAVPRELGNGVNVQLGDSLRTEFDKVRKWKSPSSELM